jgi:hypothetical protein
MNEPILAAKKLASELVERRLPILENELSKLLRELSPEEKLEIIQQVLQENVRAAAALAARGHLPVLQQTSLLEQLLESGQSNAIKHIVSKVFVHRMGAKVFLHTLYEKHRLFPRSVNLAAYYFLTASKVDSETRVALRMLFDKTKPS